MLTPGYAHFWVHYYPIGNTPAVSLTQGLPPGKRADILLLGCGDLRNILFTFHCDSRRQYDITCCDVESSILARNIILLTLILDDGNQENSANWDIYYHVFLSQSCHDRLLKQVRKLLALASSLGTWRASEYGDLIRFCDKGTLTRVAEVWAFYISAATEKQSWLKKTFKSAVKSRKLRRSDTTFTISAVRSATPAGVLAAADLNGLHNHFWSHGTLDLDKATRSQTPLANPLLVSPDEAAILHYGTDPLFGFHMSTAFMPLASDSPSSQQNPTQPKLGDIVAAAKAEFSAWCDTFRGQAKGRMTLRLFAGDALSFCHTLQHRHATGSAGTAFWYRGRHNTLDPLVLLEDDYGSNGTAPVSFNVIDTSNLLDHIGGLNLLVAASPLLNGDAASTLYAESLVPSGTLPQQTRLDELFGGHLTTTSLLLGLFPVEYWTNTSPSSVGDEELLRSITDKGEGQELSRMQVFLRVSWKRPPSSSGLPMVPLHISDAELASLLYRIYVDMFPVENMGRIMGNLNMRSLQRTSLPFYTRPNFVALLSLVESRVVTDWDRAMDTLLSRIESSRALLTGRNYMQELYLYMHLLDVHSVNTLRNFSGLRRDMDIELKPGPGLLGWPDMPSSVCITLKVLRSTLRQLTDKDPQSVGSLPVHAVLESSSGCLMPWQNVFACVQLGFGKLSTSGRPFTNSFRLHLERDPQGWQGKSPLYVAFRVPSWFLLLDPERAIVRFGVQSTPMTASKFMMSLGVEMSLYETSLGNTEAVYLSQDLPNQTGVIQVSGFTQDDLSPRDSPDSGTKTSITVHVDTQTARVASLTARVDLVSDALRSALGGGGAVQVTPVSPCTFSIAIKTSPVNITFPVPVLHNTLKTRIARSSSYIELTATITLNPATHPSPTFTCPLLCPRTSTPSTLPISPTPVCWTTPYLPLSILPPISTTTTTPKESLAFLTTHTSQMFSVREARLRAKPALLAAASPAERTRIALKESLHNLFLQFPGLVSVRPGPTASTQGERVFALRCTDKAGKVKGGPEGDILIFVSCLRSDLARRTAVLDCAVLVLTQRVLEQGAFLAGLMMPLAGPGVVVVRVDEEEMRLWREVLPAWVERCREWVHREGCEYYPAGGDSEGRAPVSLEMGEEVVCGCGKGVFPEGWGADVPMWDTVKGLCVRAAISPLFASVLAEDVVSQIGGLVSRLRDEGKAAGDGVSGCRNCGSETSKEGGELKGCGKCGRVRYCGRPCQRADWKRHKKECTAKE